MPWTVRCPSLDSLPNINHALPNRWRTLLSNLPTLMHDATHASSVYVKSRTAYFPDLSLALAAAFVNTVDLTSVAEFPTVPLCHPSTVSSSLGQSSPKSQLSSTYCCASCCVLPHTHSTDFCYCHASCHPIATIQQCFSSAYILTNFNPVTLSYLETLKTIELLFMKI